VRYEPPPEAAAFAAAVEWLWNKRKLAPAGRESRSLEGRRLTILWRGDAALVAGPSYVEQQWLAPLAPLLQSQAARLSLGTPASPGETLRAAADTGLPWPVVVSSEADLGAFTIRRRFLLAALTLVGALVLAGSYLIARAVHRELVAARLQSNFVAAVSHEFRTPLTLLRQITEAFTDGRVADEAERRRYYQAQGRATERLHRLVESLLDFGRMEAGAKPYRLETLDPARFVQGLVGEFQKEAAPGGYQVELHIAGTTPAVEADPDALTHAVWNLLDNAVKYSPGCRTVWVDLAREGDHVAIAVRDKGLGIPESEQKQIFRKFVRGAAARVNGIKGTGIGLAMVDHIVQAHGGTLRLVSAPGEGSTFTILLPASGQV
jgi:signal transduction histidine kinase